MSKLVNFATNEDNFFTGKGAVVDLSVGGSGLPSDPSFSSVVLLMGFEGADASTSFTDESGSARLMTAIGNAQLDTAQFKYGAASGLFDGTTDGVDTPDAANLSLAGGDFTIEGWVRFNGTPSGSRVIASHYLASGNQRSWYLRYGSGNSLSFVYYADGINFNLAQFAWTPVANTWYFVSVTRSGTSLIAHIDGVQIGSTHTIGTLVLHNSTANLQVAVVDGASQSFNGWIDELRITVGVARYSTASYTPPTEAFPRS